MMLVLSSTCVFVLYEKLVHFPAETLFFGLFCDLRELDIREMSKCENIIIIT